MRTIAVFILVLAASCLDAPAPSLVPEHAQVSPEIREGCALTKRKCSQCHSIDRVKLARGVGRSAWAAYIEEMRLKPSSGISVSDARLILGCVMYLEPPAGGSR